MADPDQRKKLGDASEVEAACSEVEAEIAALRAKYEQYFMGVERKPPNVEHTALKKKVAGLRNTFVRQFSAKFRVEAVTSKMLTYERLWTRTLQEIEAGTYRRDLFKLKLRTKDRAPPPPPAVKVEKKAEPEKVLKNDKAPLEKVEKKPALPGVAPAVAAASKGGPQAPPAAVAGHLSDQKVKAIFDAYVMAKRRCNEDVSKLSLDGLSQSLRRQVPELMKAHNAKSVEFKIVIKDGKAILRALPKDT